MIKRLGRKRGFTLIESLSVVAIIGIVVSLSIYLITQAQRQARDAARKSDVSAIAQGFEARFLDKTCSDQSAVGFYPGTELIPTSGGEMPWTTVETLSGISDASCNPFSTYLSIIPQDPKTPANDYYFNLSSAPGLAGKHYRIAARLEREPTQSQWDEICRLSDVWHETYSGAEYSGCGGTIGFDSPPNYLAALLGWPIGVAKALPVSCPASTHEDPVTGECVPDDPGDPPGGGGGGGGSNGGIDTCEPQTEESEPVPCTLPYNYYFGR